MPLFVSPLASTSTTHVETIVIVDDDPGLLGALKFGLEMEGFVVQAHAAADTIRTGDLPKRNACLVIDYRLPGLNGLELLRRLRANNVSLPAIIVTSHPLADLSNNIKGLDAVLIEKPLLGSVLVSAIRHALDSRAN